MEDKKEYIDREAVLTVLKTVFDESDPVGEEQFGLLKAHRIVREAPAADVAPVVRWKECKHWQSHKGARYGVCMYLEDLNGDLVHTLAQDYCSRGEMEV